MKTQVYLTTGVSWNDEDDVNITIRENGVIVNNPKTRARRFYPWHMVEVIIEEY